jgi:hypothetical protein
MGPVEAGTTVVTNVALAAAQAVVEQQTQYNETIQRSAERERKVETAKGPKAGSDNVNSNSTKKSKSQGGLGQFGFTGAVPQPQSTNPSRGSRVDLRI